MNSSPTAPSATAAVQQQDGASPSCQCTLTNPFARTGVGLHTGELISVQVYPSPLNTGHRFIRTDLPGAPVIPATADRVSQTLLSTLLTAGEATVQTVEHLLAALTAMGISNATIEVHGPEIPLMDGSAQEWVQAIAEAGVTVQDGTRPLIWLDKPLSVQHGDALVAAFPAAETRFTYGIDFESAAIGNQWHSWSPGRQLGDTPTSFASEIAPARTFGFAEQVEHLRTKGLIKGGSLDNALVCTLTEWLNPPLRFTNEPARHKLLDLVGDLSLLGTPPIAHYLAYKASHALHVQLATLLAAQM